MCSTVAVRSVDKIQAHQIILIIDAKWQRQNKWGMKTEILRRYTEKKHIKIRACNWTGLTKYQTQLADAKETLKVHWKEKV